MRVAHLIQFRTPQTLIPRASSNLNRIVCVLGVSRIWSMDMNNALKVSPDSVMVVWSMITHKEKNTQTYIFYSLSIHKKDICEDVERKRILTFKRLAGS